MRISNENTRNPLFKSDYSSINRNMSRSLPRLSRASQSIRSRSLSRKKSPTRSVPNSRKPLTRKNPLPYTVQRTRGLTNKQALNVKNRVKAYASGKPMRRRIYL